LQRGFFCLEVLYFELLDISAAIEYYREIKNFAYKHIKMEAYYEKEKE